MITQNSINNSSQLSDGRSEKLAPLPVITKGGVEDTTNVAAPVSQEISALNNSNVSSYSKIHNTEIESDDKNNNNSVYTHRFQDLDSELMSGELLDKEEDSDGHTDDCQPSPAQADLLVSALGLDGVELFNSTSDEETARASRQAKQPTFSKSEIESKRKQELSLKQQRLQRKESPIPKNLKPEERLDRLNQNDMSRRPDTMMKEQERKNAIERCDKFYKVKCENKVTKSANKTLVRNAKIADSQIAYQENKQKNFARDSKIQADIDSSQLDYRLKNPTRKQEETSFISRTRTLLNTSLTSHNKVTYSTKTLLEHEVVHVNSTTALIHFRNKYYQVSPQQVDTYVTLSPRLKERFLVNCDNLEATPGTADCLKSDTEPILEEEEFEEYSADDIPPPPPNIDFSDQFNKPKVPCPHYVPPPLRSETTLISNISQLWYDKFSDMNICFYKISNDEATYFDSLRIGENIVFDPSECRNMILTNKCPFTLPSSPIQFAYLVFAICHKFISHMRPVRSCDGDVQVVYKDADPDIDVNVNIDFSGIISVAPTIGDNLYEYIQHDYKNVDHQYDKKLSYEIEIDIDDDRYVYRFPRDFMFSKTKQSYLISTQIPIDDEFYERKEIIGLPCCAPIKYISLFELFFSFFNDIQLPIFYVEPDSRNVELVCYASYIDSMKKMSTITLCIPENNVNRPTFKVHYFNAQDCINELILGYMISTVTFGINADVSTAINKIMHAINGNIFEFLPDDIFFALYPATPRTDYLSLSLSGKEQLQFDCYRLSRYYHLIPVFTSDTNTSVGNMIIRGDLANQYNTFSHNSYCFGGRGTINVEMQKNNSKIWKTLKSAFSFASLVCTGFATITGAISTIFPVMGTLTVVFTCLSTGLKTFARLCDVADMAYEQYELMKKYISEEFFTRDLIQPSDNIQIASDNIFSNFGLYYLFTSEDNFSFSFDLPSTVKLVPKYCFYPLNKKLMRYSKELVHVRDDDPITDEELIVLKFNQLKRISSSHDCSKLIPNMFLETMFNKAYSAHSMEYDMHYSYDNSPSYPLNITPDALYDLEVSVSQYLYVKLLHSPYSYIDTIDALINGGDVPFFISRKMRNKLVHALVGNTTNEAEKTELEEPSTPIDVKTDILGPIIHLSSVADGFFGQTKQ